MGSLQFVLFLAICLCLQTARGQESCVNLSVVGGRKVSIKDAPFIATIIEDNKVVCVGSIVHSLFILTAASCISDKDEDDDEKPNRRVLVGTAQLNSSGEYYDVDKEICHNDFDAATMKNDICMLKLKSSIRFGTNVAQVGLRTGSLYLPDGTQLNVTGWGSTDSTGKTNPNRLQRTSVLKLSEHCCSEEYHDFTNEMICAGKPGHNACEGDGGAPLTLYNFLVGVYSRGPATGCGLTPGVYTRVPSYVGWMKRVVRRYS